MGKACGWVGAQRRGSSCSARRCGELGVCLTPCSLAAPAARQLLPPRACTPARRAAHAGGVPAAAQPRGPRHVHLPGQGPPAGSRCQLARRLPLASLVLPPTLPLRHTPSVCIGAGVRPSSALLRCIHPPSARWTWPRCSTPGALISTRRRRWVGGDPAGLGRPPPAARIPALPLVRRRRGSARPSPLLSAPSPPRAPALPAPTPRAVRGLAAVAAGAARAGDGGVRHRVLGVPVSGAVPDWLPGALARGWQTGVFR